MKDNVKLRILQAHPSVTDTLIRIMVGTVFLSEGIQKFLYEHRGVGRFRDEIGLPAPEVLGYWVASWEVLCGLLILLGLLTRLAVIPTITIMCVALVTTKFIRLTNEANTFIYNFWDMAHAMRTDWAMLLGSIFIFIRGAGRLSIDRILYRRMPAAAIASSARRPHK